MRAWGIDRNLHEHEEKRGGRVRGGVLRERFGCGDPARRGKAPCSRSCRKTTTRQAPRHAARQAHDESRCHRRRRTPQPPSLLLLMPRRKLLPPAKPRSEEDTATEAAASPAIAAASYPGHCLRPSYGVRDGFGTSRTSGFRIGPSSFAALTPGCRKRVVASRTRTVTVGS